MSKDKGLAAKVAGPFIFWWLIISRCHLSPFVILTGLFTKTRGFGMDKAQMKYQTKRIWIRCLINILTYCCE
jgi:hypothetical protein